MDDSAISLVSDPAGVLIGLGAVCALIAAAFWLKVARSIDTSGQVVIGPDKRSLAYAATSTALALALAGGGYLISFV